MMLVRVRSVLCAALVAVGAARRQCTDWSPAARPDARAGLKAGIYDAATASKGMTLLATRPRADTFLTLAKMAGAAIALLHQLGFRLPRQLSLSGQLRRLPDLGHQQPSEPGARVDHESAPPTSGRRSVDLGQSHSSSPMRTAAAGCDCGAQGITDTVSKDRAEQNPHLRRLSDPAHPRQITVVQTCRGTHTRTRWSLIPRTRTSRLHLGAIGLVRPPLAERTRRLPGRAVQPGSCPRPRLLRSVPPHRSREGAARSSGELEAGRPAAHLRRTGPASAGTR